MLIAEKTTDTATLLHLFEACETARQAVEQLPKSMITALLGTLSLETRQTAVAILALGSAKLSNSAERASFINTYLGHSDEPLPKLLNPLKAFLQLRDIAAAVDTLTPMYVSACMKKLEGIEAARLASRPSYLPMDYDRCSRPCWRWDNDEAKTLIYDWESDPTGGRARRAYLQHLAKAPYPWQSPIHPIENYRIQRALWRFELFCQLFPEKPTMGTGNNVELNEDRRRYLSRLQRWECEEVASIVPFLFRILERIYDPAVFRNQAAHVKRSKIQWKSFLAQAPAKKPIGCNDKPSERQNECDWEKELRFAAHGGLEEYWRLNKTGPEDNILNERTAELGHRKWMAHQVSKGLRHVLACHQQYVHDHGEVFSRHYPIQRYEPSLLYNAPAEAFLRWHYRLWGQSALDDYRLELTITKHIRQWEDMPEAHLSSWCWDSTGSDFMMHVTLNLREVGYVFWDARSKKDS